MHQLRREAVGEHIVDFTGDPGPLVQGGCLGLRRAGRPLLHEEPLSTAPGLCVQSQNVARQTEAPCRYGRVQPAAGVDRRICAERDGRGREARRERQPLQSGDGTTAPQNHRRHSGPGLLRPECRHHQQRQKCQRRPRPVLQTGPEERPGGHGTARDAHQSERHLPGPEPSAGEGAPEHDGEQNNPDGPGDQRPWAGAIPRGESFPGRPARPDRASHTRSFHAGCDAIPSAKPPYAGRICPALHISTPLRTANITARADLGAALP